MRGLSTQDHLKEKVFPGILQLVNNGCQSVTRGNGHWIQRKKSGLSPNSTSYYLWDLGQFISFSELYFAHFNNRVTHNVSYRAK